MNYRKVNLIKVGEEKYLIIIDSKKCRFIGMNIVFICPVIFHPAMQEINTGESQHRT